MADGKRRTVHFVVPDDKCGDFQTVLEFIGRRWAGAVLLAGAQGARRFTEFRKLVPGISDRLLSQRLRELDAFGLLEREVIPTTPVQILYRPSATGTELVAALQPLISWSSTVLQQGGPHVPGAHAPRTTAPGRTG